ncbi:MAG: AtzE family amidohydrolase [Ancalomicrobiaceae bacterium]|nr:AtzE family amidohydrolase [Ancalomicrobiaceae bacterium]
MSDILLTSASEIAAAVRAGKVSAETVVESSLQRVATTDSKINAFTDVTVERAIAKARTVDADIAAGRDPGPLAGVPFAVKNLFDINGLPTRAGSKINRELSPATADATLVARLEAAGAILTGGLNMGEYAYDFTGENVHDGNCLNPHDVSRMTGGSSSGSGAAVASGMVPLALGSDTNGSIRVPSSFCGLFGLKPTYGRLSRARSFPFVPSLDHLGPLARSVGDLAIAYDVCQGPDAADPHLAARPVEPASETLEDGISGLRIARLGGYFARFGHAEANAALDVVSRALDISSEIELPEVARARAAAYLITGAEGASLHFDRLKTRAGDFDPDTRDRFLANTMIPALWVTQAQKLRSWFRGEMTKIFAEYDILIAPATPCVAPRSGEKLLTLDGTEVPLRANIGVFTQPISFIGLPVVAAPIWLGSTHLPIAVQIIAAPWAEATALKVARYLEMSGVARAPVAEV